MINWKSSLIKIKDLKEFKHNPRKINDYEFQKLVKSLKEDGYHQRIIVDQNNQIIGGHQRKKALLDSGMSLNDEIEVLKPTDDLSPDDLKRINIRDNLSYGEFDFEILHQHFHKDSLIEWGFDQDLLTQSFENTEAVDVLDDNKNFEEDELPGQIPSRVKEGDTWLLGEHILHCKDSLQESHDYTKRFDLCFIDPPYGIDIDEWDKAIDAAKCLRIITKILKPDGFFAFTHQMPKMLDWLIEMPKTDFKFKDHVIWVKRITTAIGCDLNRSHESLMIYRKGKGQYFQTKGLYTDVKISMAAMELMDFQSVQGYISALHADVKAGSKKMRTQDKPKSHAAYSKMKGHSLNAPEEVNFTNVWSFLPQNQANKANENESRLDHPTVKPLKLMARILELMTPEGGDVIDIFGGSGSTLIAAEQTKRKCEMYEISPYYCDIILHRWESMTGKEAVKL